MSGYSPPTLGMGKALEMPNPWISGEYYSAGIGTQVAVTATADRVMAVKLNVPPGGVIAGEVSEVTTPGTGAEVIRMGVAKATTNDFTAQLLDEFGTVSATTVGVKEIVRTYTPPTPGIYYLLMCVQVLTTSVQFRGLSGMSGLYSQGAGSTSNQCYILDGVTGAFPSTLTLTRSGLNGPLMKVRAA